MMMIVVLRCGYENDFDGDYNDGDDDYENQDYNRNM